MAIYVYVTATGALYSYCPNDTDPVAPTATLTANGLTAVSGLHVLDNTHMWDVTSKSVLVVAAPYVPNIVRTGDWVQQFTDAEQAAILASTDPKVEHWIFVLQCSPTIDLNSAYMVAALTYGVTISLLTAPRATLLQAWTENF